MRVHSLLALSLVAVLGTGALAASPSDTSFKPAPDTRDAGPFADLCRGTALCRQVVLLRRDDAILLRVSFIHAEPFLDENQDYCDAREYWYIRGKTRVLLARDCAEQWGADSQGPVEPVFDGKQLKLEYLEWQSSDGCERTIATIDWHTARFQSAKRWTGTSSDRRGKCGRQRPAKADLHLGSGSPGDPLVEFHR